MSRRRTSNNKRVARSEAAPSATGRGNLEASLVMIAPLLFAYAIGVLFVGRVNGADVVTRAVYGALGRTTYLLAYATAALLFLLWIRRGQRWGALRLETMAHVVLEAAIYAFTLGTVISLVLDRLLGLGLDGSSIVSALGAGVHEELVFRLGICASLAALLRGTGWIGVLAAFVVSSVLFSAAHHVGAHGEAFTMHACVFRSLAGMVFAAILWFRSFAHAVYAHTIYDLVVAAR
jgi:hypothetical protein